MAYNEEELEIFLKRDIVEFLDAKSQTLGSEETDYYSEIRDALLKHETEMARNYLEAAVDDYNDISPNNVYKDIKYNKLTSTIELIKRYIEATGDTGKLSEDIAALDAGKELEKSKPPRIDALDFRKVEKQQKEFDDRAKEYEFKEELADKIKKLTQDLFMAIRKKDLDTSLEKYKMMKAYFEQFPGSFLEEKKQIYNDILAFYLQIQVMKKDVIQSQESEMADFRKQVQESAGLEKRFIKINVIKQLVTDIKKDVKDSDFASAKAKIIELRRITSKIPDRYKTIRSSLYAKVNILNQRVEFATKIAEQDDAA